MSLASEVASHVLEVFDYLGDVLEHVTIARTQPGAVDTDQGLIPTSPDEATVDAYVGEMRSHALVVFRATALPFEMEAASVLVRGDGRTYQVIAYETTVRSLVIVRARRL